MQGLPLEEPENTTSKNTNVEITQPKIVTKIVEGS
jgi:hypothetical protein